jgi:hypothetical protein
MRSFKRVGRAFGDEARLGSIDDSTRLMRGGCLRSCVCPFKRINTEIQNSLLYAKLVDNLSLNMVAIEKDNGGKFFNKV